MKKKMSFEQSITRLEEIVACLNQGDLPLEESLSLFKEGVALVDSCNISLKQTKLEIDTVLNGKEEAAQ